MQSVDTRAGERARSLLAAVLAAALGVGWFFLGHGDRTLSPRNVDWLMAGDWSQHLTGWLFFRDAPLQLPLGALPNLAHPLGTTVGYTDSNPLMALVLKPFVGVLPFPFQFIGIWFVLCFALQGFIGARLTALFTPRALTQVLGGALFALSPILFARMGHDTLCAHWLLLSLIWVNLRAWPDKASVRWALVLTFLFVGLAAAVHPYLAAMALVLGMAVPLRLRFVSRMLSWGQLTAVLVGLVGMVLGLFWLLGYLGTRTPTGLGGFGYLSADLATLVNPHEWSRWLRPLPIDRPQGEGYGYLGMGVMLLLVLGAGSALVMRRRSEWKPHWRRAVPLALAVLALAVFAFSSRISLGGKVLLNLEAVYRPVLRLVEPFRSSGRFIWPLNYALVTAALALVLGAWRRRPWVATVLVALAVGVQAYELLPKVREERFQGLNWNGLRSGEWQRLGGGYQHLVLYPPQLHDGNGRGCPVPGGAPFSPMFAYLAARLGLTFNSAYLARVDEASAQAYCAALQRDMERGVLQPGTAYVVHPAFLPALMRHPESAVCGALDGYAVCVSTAQQDDFRRTLEERRLRPR